MTLRLFIASTALPFAAAAFAQAAPAPAPMPTPPPEHEVVGATAEREKLIASCSAYKFETVVLIDPVKNRTTRVKLCSLPDASVADWVKTLNDALAQIEGRRMPAAAKTQLIDELKAEIAKYPKVAETKPVAPVAPNLVPRDRVAPPSDRFETSTLPTLDAPAPRQRVAERFETSTLPPLNAPRKTGAVAAPPKPMAVSLKCLLKGESGPGGTCDFFETSTVLAIRAVEGLEKGGRLRFLRKGEQRAEIDLPASESGAVIRAALPKDVCRGVNGGKLQLQLFAPKASSPSATLGPYGYRC